MPSLLTWCFIQWTNADGETPKECINNFINANNPPIDFHPFSYYGFCHEKTCEVLMFCSVLVKDEDLEIFPFIKKSGTVSFDDGVAFFPLCDDPKASFVEVFTGRIEKNSRKPGREGPIFGEVPDIALLDVRSAEARNKVQEFELNARRSGFLVRDRDDIIEDVANISNGD